MKWVQSVERMSWGSRSVFLLFFSGVCDSTSENEGLLNQFVIGMMKNVMRRGSRRPLAFKSRSSVSSMTARDHMTNQISLTATAQHVLRQEAFNDIKSKTISVLGHALD